MSPFLIGYVVVTTLMLVGGLVETGAQLDPTVEDVGAAFARALIWPVILGIATARQGWAMYQKALGKKDSL